MSLSLDRSLLKPVATVVAIVLSLFQIYFTGGFGVTDAHILRGTHLTLIMILVLLLVPSRKLAPGEKEGWFPILIDLALIALAIAINVYVFQEADNISRRLKYVEDVTNLDLFYGTGLVLLVLEATRRTSGWPLVIVSGSFLAYAMFGEYMPGGLAHNGIEYDRLIEQLFLLTDGIYGVPLGAAAGMIFAFVMFGAFLESSKMSSLFMDLACLLTRKSAGGPAKVSIFASALFGTISGSAAANVYGTGTFTIPLMKRVGYRPEFSGAVEAVASSGGLIMPPVMGSIAFVMAEYTGISYLSICKAALLPAAVYQRLKGDALLHIQHAGAARAAEFMTGERQHVDAHLLYVDVHMADCLHRVGVELCTDRMRQLGDLLERLNGADLVVRRHDGDQCGVLGQLVLQLLQINMAFLVNVQISDAVAFLFERFAGVEHCMMLDLGGDDMLAALGGGTVHAAADREVVRLRAAAGEQDLARCVIVLFVDRHRCVQALADDLARLIDGLLRLAAHAVQRGRIAVVLGQPRLHRVKRDFGQRGRRRVIRIYKSLFHFISTFLSQKGCSDLNELPVKRWVHFVYLIYTRNGYFSK